MAAVEQLERGLQQRFGDLAASIAHGELTLFVAPEKIVDVLRACRDEPELAFDYLVDVSGVHWPEGLWAVDPQLSTTGWPTYRVAEGRSVIEVTYHLLSTAHNHRVRLVVAVSDDTPSVPTATDLYPTATFHEREVYDFFGVIFVGHPSLTRILNPDDWVGHPQRKDYPLGGVDVEYEGAFIQPPDERVWSREVPR